MKCVCLETNKFLKDEKAIFGLTSVQQFFSIILGIALLAYVIVVIMGTLSDSTILAESSLIGSIANETGFIGDPPYALAKRNVSGFSSPAITYAINKTDGILITSGNYTVTSGGLVQNNSPNASLYNTVDFTYTYSYSSDASSNANRILGNTSTGVSNFFGSINPVYAILAILVIILVLVVLVRVVSGGNFGNRSEVGPQL